MKDKIHRWVGILIAIAMLLIVTFTPAYAEEGGAGADCKKGLVKCLFAYTITLGLPMAITLCSHGYAWCLQFMQ
ncbi:MAG: hypothetical protein SCM96_05085 [Acidobacteriota bacterium]|nr:hypothetical protein [Acidobacteriota bacterium]